MKITPDVLRTANKIIEFPVASWTEFEAQLNALQESYRSLEQQQSGLYLPHLLFRGQSRTGYKLETTLERYPVRVESFSDYYKLVHGALHEIESAAGMTWSIPAPHDAELQMDRIPFSRGDLPGYEYLVYLRHHGFPSFFLDWSRSAYVAAFFAFESAKPDQTEPVAIWAYLAYTGGAGKVGQADRPRIETLGPYVRTHRRHYIQQAEYTVCASRAPHGWMFVPHESAIGQSSGEDVLIKFKINASERTRALERLDMFNLNAFSLYGSQEALMHTMAMREFEFSERLRRAQIGKDYLRRMALAAALYQGKA